MARQTGNDRLELVISRNLKYFHIRKCFPFLVIKFKANEESVKHSSFRNKYRLRVIDYIF